jgi:hypothetical protein
MVLACYRGTNNLPCTITALGVGNSVAKSILLRIHSAGPRPTIRLSWQSQWPVHSLENQSNIWHNTAETDTNELDRRVQSCRIRAISGTAPPRT